MTTMFDAIDAYCRRSGPACGTEPVNAATNLAFLIAAIVPAPVGTHFLSHILNAAMQGWMIEVCRRHMLAKGLPPG